MKEKIKTNYFTQIVRIWKIKKVIQSETTAAEKQELNLNP
jgi:hypothetical protein